MKKLFTLLCLLFCLSCLEVRGQAPIFIRNAMDTNGAVSVPANLEVPQWNGTAWDFVAMGSGGSPTTNLIRSLSSTNGYFIYTPTAGGNSNAFFVLTNLPLSTVNTNGGQAGYLATWGIPGATWTAPAASGTTPAQVAAQIATNGNAVAAAMTNPANSFSGTFTGSGSGLTNDQPIASLASTNSLLSLSNAVRLISASQVGSSNVFNGIRITTNASTWTLNNRPAVGLNVPTFRPTAADSVMYLDLMGNGIPNGNTYGVSALDICDVDGFTNNPTPFHALHLSAHTNFLEISSVAYTGTAIPLTFTIGGGIDSPTIATLSNSRWGVGTNRTAYSGGLLSVSSPDFVWQSEKCGITIDDNVATDFMLGVVPSSYAFLQTAVRQASFGTYPLIIQPKGGSTVFSNAVAFYGAVGFSGTFTGNGGGLTNVNATGPFTNLIVRSSGATGITLQALPQTGSSSNVVARLAGTNGTSGIYVSDAGNVTNNGNLGASGNLYVAALMSAAGGFSSGTPHIPTSVTVGASPFNFTNANPSAIECYFSGGVAYTVTKNGVAGMDSSLVGRSYFILQTNSYATITYTVAPTFYTNSW